MSCPFFMSSLGTTSPIITQINILFDSSLSDASESHWYPYSGTILCQEGARTFYMLQTQRANPCGISMKQDISPALCRPAINETLKIQACVKVRQRTTICCFAISSRSLHHVSARTKNQNRRSQRHLLQQ